MSHKTLITVLIGLATYLPFTTYAAVTYGPVGERETLWGIAAKVRPDESVTVQQTMLALFRANPEAFNNNNINGLRKGTQLNLPTLSDIQRYSPQQSVQLTHQQNRDWQRGVTSSTLPSQRLTATSTRPTRTRNTSTTAAPRRTVTAPAPTQWQRQLSQLQQQLQQSERENQALTQQVAQLRTQVPTVAPPMQADYKAQVDQQLAVLRTELSELTNLLELKDNHIRTLQTSLRSASETIKSQHADNLRLFETLKSVSPESIPSPPSQAETNVATSLRLAAVSESIANASTETLAVEAATEAVESTEKAENTEIAESIIAINEPEPAEATENENGNEGVNDGVNDGIWAKPRESSTEMRPSNDVRTSTSIPLSQMLAENAQQATTRYDTEKEWGLLPLSRHGVSPLAWLAVLASLIFILVLVSRMRYQQRMLKRLEEEDKLLAEAERKRSENLRHFPDKDKKTVTA